MAITPHEEALKIAEGILETIQENRPLSVTNLLRRCVAIAKLLELKDTQWINNELKGYPDNNVPSYRIIDVECNYSWVGILPPQISR